MLSHLVWLEVMSFSEEYPYKKKYRSIYGKKMAYMEHGEGDPIVFIHGNPTSSYLWRNIMPYLEDKGRLIAPDLIGMGDSEKLDNSGPDRYGFVEQRKFLFALLDDLGVDANVTLVVHDWGSTLGFDWAYQHAKILKGIAFMESLVEPFASWDSFPKDFEAAIKAFRSEAGEGMVLKNNIFIEQVLPTGIMRNLSDAEMAEYRRPFLNKGEDRRPSLSFARDVPIAGEPAEVWDVVSDFSAWLSLTDVPKLFVNVEPGALVDDSARKYIRSWSNVTETTVSGHHFVQEDSPEEIGVALSEWYEKIG